MSQFIEMFGNPITNNKRWPSAPMSEVAPESPSNERIEGKVWLLNLDMVESNTGRIIDKVYEDSSNLISVAPFDGGNVLLSKLRPYLNKVVNSKGKGYATTELVPLRPRQEKLNKTFFTALLRGDDFVKYANSIATGTKMPRLPLTDFRKMMCILPPIDLQNQFAAIYEQHDKSEFGGLKSQFIEMFGNTPLNLQQPSDVFKNWYKDITSKTEKIPASEYKVTGNYPIYDQAQDNEIAGYKDEEDGLCYEIPCVLFGDHSRVVKYIDKPFYIGADGVKIILPISSDMSAKFLYYDLLFHEIPNTGYNRHFKYVKMIHFTKPEKEKQDAFLQIAEQHDKSEYYS